MNKKILFVIIWVSVFTLSLLFFKSGIIPDSLRRVIVAPTLLGITVITKIYNKTFSRFDAIILCFLAVSLIILILVFWYI